MSSLLLIDFSSARPFPPAIKQVGYAGVIVYLTPDEPWSIHNDPAYLQALLATGLSVRFVYEVDPQAALGGHSQGAYDGAVANHLADLAGVPAHLPIYYACADFAIPANMVPMALAYRASAAAQGRPAYVYGPKVLIDAAGGGWQNAEDAAGELGSVVSTVANIYQRISPTLPGAWGLGDIDEDVLLIDDGAGWVLNMPAPTPTPTPAPAPTPTPAPPAPAPTPPVFNLTTRKKDRMYIVESTVNGAGGYWLITSAGTRVPVVDGPSGSTLLAMLGQVGPIPVLDQGQLEAFPLA